MQRRVFRTPDAAIYLGINASTLEKMRVYGNGPRFTRIGSRAVGYTIEDLDEFIRAGQCVNTSDDGARPPASPRPPAGAAPTPSPKSKPASKAPKLRAERV